jgi:hypothetical protein
MAGCELMRVVVASKLFKAARQAGKLDQAQ